MKKRLISMLLAVLMVVSLFSGMSLSAYADDGDIIEYTMQDGDTVYKVCTNLGLNYYTCQKAIMTLNGFTEQSFYHIPVGKVIKLPKSNAVATTIAASGSTVTNSTTVGSTTTTTTTGLTANGDSIAYWLVPYTMQRGETIYGVCNALGIKYNTYSDQIQKLNNLQSLAWVKAGQTLLFPSPVKPAVGVSCYQVQAHKVTAGETVFSICNNAGVSYTGNIKLLQAMNNNSNLNNIKAGSTFYVPVSTVISASASNGTSGGSTTPTATPAASGSTAAKTLAITGNIAVGNGTVEFYVGGKVVSAAAAGDKVTVVVTPKDGKAVSSIAVKLADGTADVAMTGDTFVMPNSAVRVDVDFATGYNLTANGNYPTKLTMTVDGITSKTAAAGSVVKVVSNDPAYVMDGSIKYTSKGVNVTDKLTKPTADSFVMPAYDVDVYVTLKTVKTYALNALKSDNGSFVMQVNGVTVSKAAKGVQVTIIATPDKGYVIDDRSNNGFTVVRRDNNSAVSCPINIFTMPASDVDVTVRFVKAENEITLNPAVGGTFLASIAEDSDTPIYDLATGQKVYIVPTADTAGGYSECYEVIATRKSDGSLVPVSPVTTTGVDAKFVFDMPAGGVNVTARFRGALRNLTATAVTGGRLSFLVNGTAATQARIGDTVEAVLALDNGYTLEKYEAKLGTTANESLTDLLNHNSRFTMPAGAEDVEVTAVLKKADISIPAASISGSGTVFYSKAGSGNINACNVGDTVIINAEANAGYTIDKSGITVKNAITGELVTVTQSGAGTTEDPIVYSFVMPAEGATVAVAFAKEKLTLTVGSVVEAGTTTPELANAIKLTVGDGTPLTSSVNTVIDAEYGATVTVGVSDGEKANYSISKITLDGVVISGNSFKMPNNDATVSVELTKNRYKVNLSYNKSQGTVGTEVNGVDVWNDRYQEGETVTIYARPNKAGYHVTKMTVVGPNNEPIALDVEDIKEGTAVSSIQFVMPKGEVTVKTEFYKDENELSIKVVDANGKDVTSKLLVQVTVAGELKGVNDLGSMGPVLYKVWVSVALSPAAVAEGRGIASVYYHYGKTEGYASTFAMPDQDTSIVVTLY